MKNSILLVLSLFCGIFCSELSAADFNDAIRLKALYVEKNDKAYAKHPTVENAAVLTYSLKLALTTPDFVKTVCQRQKECLSGAFSFENEAIGLINSLKLEIPYIRRCVGNVACIYAKDHDIHEVLNADLGQIDFVLRNYLI